jgi:hypothetical protein
MEPAYSRQEAIESRQHTAGSRQKTEARSQQTVRFHTAKESQHFLELFQAFLSTNVTLSDRRK